MWSERSSEGNAMGQIYRGDASILVGLGSRGRRTCTGRCERHLRILKDEFDGPREGKRRGQVQEDSGMRSHLLRNVF